MPKRILYVEDDVDIADIVKLILKNAGFEVETAYTGEHGIEKVTKDDFDLILLDMMLPRMTGWDVFEAVKDKTDAKFAFLSSFNPTQETMERMKFHNISDYMMKPFKKAELIARVSKILE